MVSLYQPSSPSPFSCWILDDGTGSVSAFRVSRIMFQPRTCGRMGSISDEDICRFEVILER